MPPSARDGACWGLSNPAGNSLPCAFPFMFQNVAPKRDKPSNFFLYFDELKCERHSSSCRDCDRLDRTFTGTGHHGYVGVSSLSQVFAGLDHFRKVKPILNLTLRRTKHPVRGLSQKFVDCLRKCPFLLSD